MRLRQLIEFLENHAPSQLQESYDNSGLLVGDANMEIQSVLVALDSTEAIIDEAIAIGANVIVVHHPIIFSGLRQLTGANYIQRTVIKAIKNDIAIYAIHTNLDSVSMNGVNSRIADKLGLEKRRILAPKSTSLGLNQEVGAGMIGSLPSPLPTLEFLKGVKSKMNVSVIKHTALVHQEIKTVAICGGSGRFLLDKAIQEKADVYISADFKYHEFFDANGQIIIADIGHYESEQFTIELLVEIISDNFTNFAAHFTKNNTNPVQYL